MLKMLSLKKLSDIEQNLENLRKKNMMRNLRLLKQLEKENFFFERWNQKES